MASRPWVVTARKCNRSAFNGYRLTSSDYSEVRCHGITSTGHRCTGMWRTKAAYVEALFDGDV